MQCPDRPTPDLSQAARLQIGDIRPLTGARPPANEDERLAALQACAILDSAPEPAYDRWAADAANVCATPMALISLVDAQRQWFKARVGMQPAETPRELSFCAHALLAPDQVLEVNDARSDPRFADNALVTGAPHIRFYAGAPLVTADGHALGTLCVLDQQPRRLSAAERTALQALARQVVDSLALRRAAALIAQDSLRDPLTDTCNLAGLERAMQQLAAASASAAAQAAGLLLIELDGFKRLRLQAATQADAALVQAARIIEAQVPEAGCIARLEADRFCALLPSAAEADGMTAAERIRAAIAAASWSPLPLTASIGVVVPTGPATLSLGVLLARARHALQQACLDGRNQVHRFDGWHYAD
ncbi:sensor domain-containing diguanylate cyclase [Xanthomonas maliensis]|uniref:sensor domain-containing diguanylate cyclase n=1 Tax=Xanthomonas maliensis TaxID=1321368 RepID=UPI0003A93608|nr:GAF domain-containing protein [Xanthomonas maliensis]KAB7764851.1 GGDEF domain-containing protein [Xanthomonas maliensis]